MLDSKVVCALKSGGAFLTGQGCAGCLGGLVCESTGARRHCLAVMDVGVWCVGGLVTTALLLYVAVGCGVVLCLAGIWCGVFGCTCSNAACCHQATP